MYLLDFCTDTSNFLAIVCLSPYAVICYLLKKCFKEINLNLNEIWIEFKRYAWTSIIVLFGFYLSSGVLSMICSTLSVVMAVDF